MSKDKYSRKFCVAPMMGYTTPHARKLYRILSQKTFLFTEMIAASTMLHSKTKDLIIENDLQNPIALQVGGSDIDDLALCSKIAKSYNYDEINLNVGCPSKAVQKGSFGACLMQDKKLVRACLETMQNASDIEVTMKCRIGLGNDLNYDYFSTFIDEIVQSGINIIYVHARNAILNGISPKGNRSIPRLNYEFVKKIKKEHPHVQFILNGGIDSLDKAYALSKEHDGVMLGREAYQNPSILLDADQLYFDREANERSAKDAVRALYPYIDTLLAKGAPLHYVSRHILGLFNGKRGARLFRRFLSERAHLRESGTEVLEEALQLVD